MISKQIAPLRIAMNRYMDVLEMSNRHHSRTRTAGTHDVVGIRHNIYAQASHIFKSVYFLNVCGYSIDNVCGYSIDNSKWVIKSTTAISQHSTIWDCRKWLYLYVWRSNTIYD